MMEECNPEKRVAFWNDSFGLNYDSWDKIHLNNFKCSIYTRIRSFYIKLFYKAIALNDFLHKIKKKDSPNTNFCNTEPESFTHLFDCNVVKPTCMSNEDKMPCPRALLPLQADSNRGPHG